MLALRQAWNVLYGVGKAVAIAAVLVFWLGVVVMLVEQPLFGCQSLPPFGCP